MNGINVALVDTLEGAHGVKFFDPVEEAFLPVLGGSNSQLELTINALLVNHVSDHIRPSVSSHFCGSTLMEQPPTPPTLLILRMRHLLQESRSRSLQLVQAFSSRLARVQ